MLLHRVPPTTEERRSGALQDVEHVHELPELPEGVVVPEDLSGLELPTPRTGVHWLRWVAALAVVVIAAAVVLLVQGGGDTEPTVVMSPAAEIVQSEIDAAIAEQQVAQQLRSHYADLYGDYLAVQPLPAYQIVQSEIDAAIAEQQVAQQLRSHYADLYGDYLAVQPLPAYQIVQNEIDAAIAELAQPAVVMSPAAEIIQSEIDHAINEQAVLDDILAYYEDLAARTD